MYRSAPPFGIQLSEGGLGKQVVETATQTVCLACTASQDFSPAHLYLLLPIWLVMSTQPHDPMKRLFQGSLLPSADPGMNQTQSRQQLIEMGMFLNQLGVVLSSSDRQPTLVDEVIEEWLERRPEVERHLMQLERRHSICRRQQTEVLDGGSLESSPRRIGSDKAHSRAPTLPKSQEEVVRTSGLSIREVISTEIQRWIETVRSGFSTFAGFTDLTFLIVPADIVTFGGLCSPGSHLSVYMLLYRSLTVHPISCEVIKDCWLQVPIHSSETM
ncbi:unnamed protein product [Protopolystoma xenopodis]|uniref:Uncharacterized protein n=1 Tax=Protopolystoma xenopodis TaxID=117903 RepID=A0A3S5CSP3_9PLAT|nr:unnamed protein product [Protopolystoma xenopodis]